MNHYERLKVSQDAPPEVIRAAYRALAAKLHPDRLPQGVAPGPDDVTHSQMAALNQAYEVLIDPKLRLKYDATLAPSRPMMAEPSVADSVAPDLAQEPATRVDMDWLTPKASSSSVMWPPSRRAMLFGGSTVAIVVLLGISWSIKMQGQQHRMERALSDQYAKPSTFGTSAPDVTTSAERAIERDVLASAQKQGSSRRHRPSVEELSRMSDEELLKVLPTLDGPDNGTAPVSGSSGEVKHMAAVAQQRQAAMRHPLDGKPLSGLRTDMQMPEVLMRQDAGKGSRP